MAIRGFLGIALAAAALCFVPLRAGASQHRPAQEARRGGHRASASYQTVSERRKEASRKPAAKSTAKRHYRRRRYRHHRVILPKAPSEDRTEQIQSALGRGGYYTDAPSGRWDAKTQEALRRFQEANGLPPTGKLDALSLQRLGLGSDVAGVSAPKPLTLASRTSPVPKSPGQ
jgi:peptidoglycan hydrolase-like protein with peptidoglycan-binding domain